MTLFSASYHVACTQQLMIYSRWKLDTILTLTILTTTGSSKNQYHNKPSTMMLSMNSASILGSTESQTWLLVRAQALKIKKVGGDSSDAAKGTLLDSKCVNIYCSGVTSLTCAPTGNTIQIVRLWHKLRSPVLNEIVQIWR